jgi:SAM-dependent methyltransferase
MECLDRGAAHRDVYAASEHGYAERHPRRTADPTVIARRKQSARRQFLRVFDHLTNIADPLGTHLGLVGKHVLDFGCGTGALAVALALRGATVSAVDPTPASLEACRWRARYFGLDDSCVTPHLIDARPLLPFEDGTFDMVTVNSVLEFIPFDRDRYVHEMLRVLRPGGHLVISGENGLFPFDYYTRQVAPRLRRRAMIARNLPYGVDYFELLRWLKSGPRPVENLSTRNWFNSVDKLATRQAEAGRSLTGGFLRLANGALRSLCRTAGLPSDILLPYAMFIFRVR